MNEIKIFENKDFGKIRAQEINGEPYFVGKDVCMIFGDANHSRSLGRIYEEDKRYFEIIDKLGRKQNVVMINESGLYSLLFAMQPRKANNNGVSNAYPIEINERIEKLHKFKRWVTSEVLPSIRKNGGYIQNQENLSDDELMAKALLVAKNKINEKNMQIENMKPNYLLGKAVSGSNKSIEVGFLANILVQNGRKDLGRNNLFVWLRENGYLSSRKGADWNRPTYKSTSQDLLEVKENIIPHNNGYTTISFTPLVTPKGQKYFIDKFIYKGED